MFAMLDVRLGIVSSHVMVRSNRRTTHLLTWPHLKNNASPTLAMLTKAKDKEATVHQSRHGSQSQGKPSGKGEPSVSLQCRILWEQNVGFLQAPGHMNVSHGPSPTMTDMCQLGLKVGHCYHMESEFKDMLRLPSLRSRETWLQNPSEHMRMLVKLQPKTQFT